MTKCAWCGREFTPPFGKKLTYCSPECRYEKHKESMRKYDKKKREGQKTKVRYCKICGDMINLATGRTKYCSVECAKIGEKNKRAEFYLRLAEEKAEVEPLNAYVLDEAEREVETYNKTHGTNYSYGWYQHLKKLGHLL